MLEVHNKTPQPETTQEAESFDDLLEQIKGKKIAQIHYSLNGTDGVSLQAQETEEYLTLVGAETHSIAADIKADQVGMNIPELNYHGQEVALLRAKITDPAVATFSPEEKLIRQAELMKEIYDGAEVLYNKLIRYIDQNELDIVHIRNLSSLPFLHIQAAVAVDRIIKDRPEVKFVLHHHDFYWEGPGAARFITYYEGIRQLGENITAPNYENTKHICINTIAKRELKERKGVDSEFIPDGLNFDKEVLEMSDEMQKRFLEKYGIKENDLVFALTTRTRSNKGYQTAVRIIKNLQDKRETFENFEDGLGRNGKNITADSKIFLIAVQSADFDEKYYAKVLEYAESMGVELIYVGDSIVSDISYTGEDRENGKVPFYSLTRSNIIDAVLYVPTHEGFGNQAIEAAWAKLMMVMFGYPVAIEDIFNHVDGIIRAGDSNDTEPWLDTSLPVVKQEVVARAADDLIRVLKDHEEEKRIVDRVYEAFRLLCHIQNIGMQYLKLYLVD